MPELVDLTDAFVQEYQQLQQEVELLRGQLQSDRVSDSVRQQLNQLQDELTIAQNESARLRAELEASRRELEITQQKLLDTDSRLAETAKVLPVLSDQVREGQARLMALQKQLQVAQAEASSLRQQLDESKRELDNARRELTSRPPPPMPLPPGKPGPVVQAELVDAPPLDINLLLEKCRRLERQLVEADARYKALNDSFRNQTSDVVEKTNKLKACEQDKLALQVEIRKLRKP